MKTRTSTKGKNLTSDFIDYKKAMLKGNELLWDKNPIIGFYIIFALNSGLRVSDIKKIKHSDLIDKEVNSKLELIETKTGKRKELALNAKIINSYSDLCKKLNESGGYNKEGLVFVSQKNTVYSTVSLNRILKRVFAGYAEHISTHSLRKGFGRHVYELNERSEAALVMLSLCFQHSSIKITRGYLGITREEINDIYINL